MSVVCELDGVGVRRGEAEVLSGVSFPIARGEVLGLVGPNGAGKSTLLSTIAGTLVPSQGVVRLDGRALDRARPDRLAQQRGVLFQELPMELPYLVRELVGMGADVPQPAAPARAERIRSALAAVELADFAERVYSSLSGGEKRRAQLARVLAQLALPDAPGDRLLVLDEPFAGLDIREADRVLRLVRRLRDLGVATVVALHDLAMAPALCDRLLVLERGRMIALAPPVEALTSEACARVFGAVLERATSASGSTWVMRLTAPG